MLDTKGLLEVLRRRGVTQADMARALNLPTPRISEMYAGRRQVKLDEAKRLVEAFRLEEAGDEPPISEATARLLALHVARRLGKALAPDDALVQDLAADLVAFSRFARGHRPEPSAEAVRGFFAGRLSGQPSHH